VTTVTGIDVQSIEEVAASLVKFGDRYRRRLFTNRELDECGDRAEITARELATRFAAKEAVLKILNPSDVIPSWRSIEIQRSGRRFEVVLTAGAAVLARRRGIDEFLLSTSYGGGFAMATVTAETAPFADEVLS
jgi:holo-[acyl-carrier protein] synthase